MLPIFILLVFIYLLYRVFSKIIDNLEALISYLFNSAKKQPSVSSKPTQVQSKQPKISKAPSGKEVSRQKSLIVNPSEKKIIKLQKVPTSSKQPQQKPKQEVRSEILPVRKEEVKSQLTYKQFESELIEEAREKQQVERLKEELEECQTIISRMEEQIEKHKQQKAQYVSKIEEIIQHVIKEQEKPIVMPNNSSDEEMRALAELTKGIDLAHQTEAKKFEKREQELKENMKLQQDSLHQKHLQQVQQLTAKLSSKEEELYKLKLQLRSYTEELKHQQEPQQRESDRLQLQLAAHNQEISELKKQLQINEGKIRSSEEQTDKLTAQLNESKRLLADLQAKRLIESQRLEESQKHIATLNKDNQDMSNKLEQALKEIEIYKSELAKLRNRSSIEENDKLQSEIQLQSRLQSLQEIKAQLQLQITQLNETIQTQERDSQQQVSSLKEELGRRHEQEVQRLNKLIQREEEEKLQAQKKILDIQSELQFVQIQLKSTIQSEKQLQDQVKVLKSPKKQDRTISPNLSGIRVNSESTQLNKKIEQTPKQFQKTQPQVTLVVEKKINYARTKIQRQASPTFQYESKDGSPLNENKSKDKQPVVSTIFGGVMDKMKSPIDLRYNTPVQKTVVQSSIYEGGIVSEGYFGQTNILNQFQRDFLIAEINNLKKISAKKTRLIYRSLNNNTKPISDYVSNVPNLLVVVQLTNKKILGAFTQAAFNKELANQAQKKYMSNNKALIIDVTNEKVVQNISNTETIKYDEKMLIWGKNELVVSSEQPLLLSCDLNGQGAVYPCKFSSEQWCGGSGSEPISQFEVYRIFLG